MDVTGKFGLPEQENLGVSAHSAASAVNYGEYRAAVRN